jgi:hypothetical protein
MLLTFVAQYMAGWLPLLGLDELRCGRIYRPASLRGTSYRAVRHRTSASCRGRHRRHCLLADEPRGHRLCHRLWMACCAAGPDSLDSGSRHGAAGRPSSGSVGHRSYSDTAWPRSLSNMCSKVSIHLSECASDEQTYASSSGGYDAPADRSYGHRRCTMRQFRLAFFTPG